MKLRGNISDMNVRNGSTRRIIFGTFLFWRQLNKINYSFLIVGQNIDELHPDRTLAPLIRLGQPDNFGQGTNRRSPRFQFDQSHTKISYLDGWFQRKPKPTRADINLGPGKLGQFGKIFRFLQDRRILFPLGPETPQRTVSAGKSDTDPAFPARMQATLKSL